MVLEKPTPNSNWSAATLNSATVNTNKTMLHGGELMPTAEEQRGGADPTTQLEIGQRHEPIPIRDQSDRRVY